MRSSSVLLATVLAVTACRVTPTDLDAPAVLGDTEGAIDLAVMVLSSPRRSGLRNQELVERVVRGVDPAIRFLILADREMILDPNPEPERMRFVEIPEDTSFTIWPQDPFVVLEDPESGPRLLAARAYGRQDDRRLPQLVAAALGWPLETSSLFFAGGNVLADERRAFVGADLIRENADELGWSAEQVTTTFRRELGRPIHVVGSSPQPVAHIDMVLTPLGRDAVAVADSRSGATIAEAALTDRPAAVGRFERDAMAGFFGHPRLSVLTDDEGNVWRAPAIGGATATAVEESRAVAPLLDGIADDLARVGYTVHRVPLLMIREGRGPTNPAGAGYPVLSYNNVLIERRGGRRIVYAPAYGFPDLDEAGRAAWERAGFEVRTVRGVTTSAMYRGSLRCNVKVLARGE